MPVQGTENLKRKSESRAEGDNMSNVVRRGSYVQWVLVSAFCDNFMMPKTKFCSFRNTFGEKRKAEPKICWHWLLSFLLCLKLKQGKNWILQSPITNRKQIRNIRLKHFPSFRNLELWSCMQGTVQVKRQVGIRIWKTCKSLEAAKKFRQDQKTGISWKTTAGEQFVGKTICGRKRNRKKVWLWKSQLFQGLCHTRLPRLLFKTTKPVTNALSFFRFALQKRKAALTLFVCW